MADEIRQVIGIDVSQAIQAIDQLETKLSGFGQKLGTLAGQLNTFNASAKGALNFNDANKSLNETTKILDQFGNPIKNLNDAAAASEKMGTSVKAAGAAIQQTFGQRIASNLKTFSDRFGSVGRQVYTFGSRGVNVFRDVGTAIKNFSQNASQNLGRFSGGFSTFVRVLTTQAIVRSLSAIQRAFSDAIRGAVDFQRTIAEITTLGEGGFFNSFDNAADAVRRLSDEFNAPIGEVGEGLYQVISNQIQGAANQVDVLTESLRLSRAGIADVGASVNLVTGTINAFQLAQSDADRVSAVFFKTVELGRTRIEELATTFGTVAPLAGEAGVRFEELAAAFSTLTINGVQTSKAGTQLRGIVNALLKPTDTLKEVFEEFGFASGEVALDSLGLVGTLQLLDKATGGSAEEMSKLIPRIRGLAGAQILARDGAAGLARNLQRTEEAARDLAAQKVEIIFATPAEEVTRALNQIRNALTVELGQAILDVASTLQSTLGAFTRFADVISAGTPFILALVAALGTYIATSIIAAGTTRLLESRFLSLFTAANITAKGIIGAFSLVAVAGVTAAFAIQRAAEQGARQSGEEATKLAKETADKILSEERKNIADRLNEERRAIRGRAKLLQESLADIRARLAERTKLFQEENKKIQKDTERVFKVIADANADLISNLSRERQDATDAAIDAETRAADRRAALADTQFGFENQRFNKLQQTVNLEQRAAQLGEQAAAALAKAETERDLRAAQSIATRAEGFQQEALALAEQTGNRALIARLQQSSVSLQEDLIRGEEAQAALQKQRANELKAIEQQERKRVTQLNEQIKRATDLQAELKFGDDTVDRDAILKELQTTLGEIDRLSIPEQGKLQASDIIALQTFRKDIIEGVGQLEFEGVNAQGILSGQVFTDFEVRLATAISEATTQGLRAALEAGVPADIVQQAAGAQGNADPFSGIDSLVTAVNQFRDKQLRIAENSAKLSNAALEMREAAAEQISLINRNIGFAEAFSSAAGKVIGRISEVAEVLVIGAQAAAGQDSNLLILSAAAPQLDEFQRELITLGERTRDIPAEQANAVLQEFNQRLEAFRNRLGASARQGLSTELRTLDLQVESLNKRIQTQNQQQAFTSEQVNRGLAGVSEITNAANEGATGVVEQARLFAEQNGVNTEALNQQAAAATTINTQLQAASRVQLPAPGGQGPGSRIGRFFPRFLAGGGFAPRGTDTVPAMLSPGEFVVNAKSTKRFFSDLQSINAGVRPAYRQDGGSVTQVGDINVTVSARKESAETGRQIARSIRRELRRGTSSL